MKTDNTITGLFDYTRLENAMAEFEGTLIAEVLTQDMNNNDYIALEKHLYDVDVIRQQLSEAI